MGNLFTFFKHKYSTLEKLESLEKEIQYLEKNHEKYIRRERAIVFYLIAYSVVIYVTTASLLCIFYFPKEWKKRLTYLAPFVIFPVLIWFIKRFLNWYFIRRVTFTDRSLKKRKEEKQKILEEVKEKETYKRAKEILEKYDPDSVPSIELPASTPVKKLIDYDGQELRKRSKSVDQSTPSKPSPNETPQLHSSEESEVEKSNVGDAQSKPPLPPNCTTPIKAKPIPAAFCPPPHQVPLPRPILPRERSSIERVMEWIVGDGPQNRYALICKKCISHNGMALKEEFEYISFRCCYCFYMNEARKKQMHIPRKLEPTEASVHDKNTNIKEKKEDQIEKKSSAIET
ncbi:DgyrCDS2049 [Dimorphilus gyrociliatus]|uniref:Endoplasmic reticulum junction formation protein lunapark n=1 Tax=Dimorphilus gyrociliatus TaxID=2664684 RepID=A0A7I8V9B2_9ANNE|nr:DgyrCDS2049 [Dimorphilus gyrociliatus]